MWSHGQSWGVGRLPLLPRATGCWPGALRRTCAYVHYWIMFTRNEHSHEVNTILARVTSVLADLDIAVTREAPGDKDLSVDVILTFDAGGRGRVRYPAQITLGRLDRQRAAAMALPPERPLLLIAPHVPDTVADVLRQRDVDFVDAAGNVRLAWEGMLVDVRGRRPREGPALKKDPSAPRAFTRSGAMVVFALLSWPDMAARPVRDIAAVSGTAVGTVHTVLSALAAAGYVYETSAGAGLNRAGELLDRWAEAYAVNLARKLELGSFSMADRDRLGVMERALLDQGVQVGGELAGSRIDPHLRPTTATFYASELPAELVAKFRLRRDDVGGLIHFRRRFWHRTDEGGTLVPSPLVFADLVSSGDPRQREHAERIRSIDDRLVELDRS